MASLSARASRIRNPVLFICDIQEQFRMHIYAFSAVVSTSQKLLRASTALNIPVYVTTQNKRRLGDTVPEILSNLPETVIANVDKTAFSMYLPDAISSIQSHIKSSPGNSDGSDGSDSSADSTDPKIDVILVGIEAHVCVTQTALDALAAGHRVYIIADGVSSINPEERGIALSRLRDAGAIVTTSESIIFEVLKDAKEPAFKGISALVKEAKEDTKEAVKVLCKY